MCDKKYYDTKREAKKKKNIYENKFNVKYEIYRCRSCGGFHLNTKVSDDTRDFYRTKWYGRGN